MVVLTRSTKDPAQLWTRTEEPNAVQSADGTRHRRTQLTVRADLLVQASSDGKDETDRPRFSHINPM